MDVELRLLQCALTLAEHGNFARAAKAIHMSQPSLSRNIQELERRLGVKLFSRDRRIIEPTSAGELLLERARDIKASADDLVREMDLLRGLQKGTLSVGAGIYPGSMFVDKALGRLICDHPAARISIAYDHALDLVPRLLKRELDLAVLFFAPETMNSQLHITKLKPHLLFHVVRAGHPFAKLRRPIHLSEVMQYPFMGPPRVPLSYLKKLMRAVTKRSQKTPPGFSITCDSIAMMKHVILESSTVGLLPLNLVLPEVENGSLVTLAVSDSVAPGAFAIARLHHRSLSPLGEKLVRLIIESDNELVQMEHRFLSANYPGKAKSRHTSA